MKGDAQVANRPANFKLYDVRRAIRAARAEGLANPSVRIRTPGGTEFYVSGGAVEAPKKHTTAAVARPPPTRAAGRSRRGGGSPGRPQGIHATSDRFRSRWHDQNVQAASCWAG